MVYFNIKFKEIRQNWRLRKEFCTEDKIMSFSPGCCVQPCTAVAASSRYRHLYSPPGRVERGAVLDSVCVECLGRMRLCHRHRRWTGYWGSPMPGSYCWAAASCWVWGSAPGPCRGPASQHGAWHSDYWHCALLSAWCWLKYIIGQLLNYKYTPLCISTITGAVNRFF